ncbi:MAG: hypothetical protein JWR21_4225 [Herminiimonas sp.]|nr:hypothetical protein [Herminiimonas sp.]MDB5855116.1 hypothetical protein [Herminiimonas sp.]
MNAKSFTVSRSGRRWLAGLSAVCLAALPGCSPVTSDELAPIASRHPPPPSSYPEQPVVSAPPDDGALKRVPGSAAAMTMTQIRNLNLAPDWYPSDHPPMPSVVSQGRKPDTFACGYCHYPNGQGRPENASLAGLSASYISQQMADFKSGQRKSSEPKMRAVALMVANAKAVTDEEVMISANYFASIPFKPWVRVVETDTVPKTSVSGFMLVPVAGGGMEPIGQRVIEVAEDLARTSVRDSRSGFVAYVPIGSIRKGEKLVNANARGATTSCVTCHGIGLKGQGDIPPLAGRSPSYSLRQLYDFQSGARAGKSSAAMREAVSTLTMDDMVSIVAYSASLAP